MISKLLKITLVLNFVFISLSSEAARRKRRKKPRWKTKVEGEFQPQVRLYSNDSNEDTEDVYSDFLTNFKLKAKKRRHRAKLNLVARAVSEDTASSQAYVREAWYSYKSRGSEFLAGVNYFTWSTLEVFHPIEILNAREFIDRELIGETMISYKKDWEDKNLRFYYLPMNTDNIYASARTRGGLTKAGTYWVEDNDKLYSGRLAHNFALEWNQSLDSLDYRLLFYHGPDRTTEFFTLDGSGLHPIFFKTTSFGASLQASYFGSTWKLEVLSKNFSHEYLGLKPKSHSVLAFGWERQFIYDSGLELTALFEIQKASGAEKNDLESYYTFQDDIFIGARFNLGDIKGTEFLIGLLHDLSRKSENAINIEYSRRLNSKWKIELGSQIRLAKQKSVSAVGLERLDGQNYVYTKLFYYFR